MFVSGSIIEALKKSRDIGALTIVFVSGSDKLSQTFETLLKDVFHGVTKPTFVAIKIWEDSHVKYLKQIYHSVPIPSVFFISQGGHLVGLISSAVDKEYFNRLAKQALNDHASYILQEQEEIEDEKQFVADIQAEHSEPTSFGTNKENMPAGLHHNKSVKIQFRVPSSQVVAHVFPPDTTLQAVYNYVVEELKVKRTFRLVNYFPRRTFTDMDKLLTLDVLELTPSATLLVEFITPSSHNGPGRSIGQVVVAWCYNLLETCWRMVTSWFYPAIEPTHVQSEPTSRKPTRSSSNIHKLRLDSDLPKSDSTDNGNSTQQQ